MKMGALLASMILLTLMAALGAQDYADPIAAVGMLIIVVFGGALVWSMRKYQETHISESGVTQLTLRGPLFVPWDEVQALRIYGGAYILDSPRGQVIVNPKAYENSAAVASYVADRMRPVMEARGARVVQSPKRLP